MKSFLTSIVLMLLTGSLLAQEPVKKSETPPKKRVSSNQLLEQLIRQEAEHAKTRGDRIGATLLFNQIARNDLNDIQAQNDAIVARNTFEASIPLRNSPGELPGDSFYDAGIASKVFQGRLKITQFYDDNVGAFPTSNQFQQLFFGPEESAGNLYQFDGVFNLYESAEDMFSVGGGIYATSNYEAHQFDLLAPNVFAQYQHIGERNGMRTLSSVRVGYGQSFLGSDGFLNNLSVRPTFALEFDELSSIVGYYQFNNLNFLNQVGTSSPFSAQFFDQDSQLHTTGVTYNQKIPGCDLRWAVGYEWAANLSQGSDYDYRSHGLNLSSVWDLNSDWSIQANGKTLWRDYLNDNFLLARKRGDINYIANISLVRHIAKDFDAFVGYSINRNDSNLVINDLERKVVQGGIEFRF